MAVSIIQAWNETTEQYESVKLDPDTKALSITERALGGWADHNVLTVPIEPGEPLRLPDFDCNELRAIADPANTKMIYFGGANVSSTKSLHLNKEDVVHEKRVSNANQFYVIAAAGDTGQKLRIQTR